MRRLAIVVRKLQRLVMRCHRKSSILVDIAASNHASHCVALWVPVSYCELPKSFCELALMVNIQLPIGYLIPRVHMRDQECVTPI